MYTNTSWRTRPWGERKEEYWGEAGGWTAEERTPWRKRVDWEPEMERRERWEIGATEGVRLRVVRGRRRDIAGVVVCTRSCRAGRSEERRVGKECRN